MRCINQKRPPISQPPKFWFISHIEPWLPLVQVDELFYEFDATPVGVASLAQVHGATLRDGSRVAVKVQHPDVKAHSFIDINTMEVSLGRVGGHHVRIAHCFLAPPSPGDKDALTGVKRSDADKRAETAHIVRGKTHEERWKCCANTATGR